MTEKNIPSKPAEAVKETEQQAVSIYEKLVQMVADRVNDVKSVVDAETLGNIIDKAAAELKGVGDYSVDAITSVTQTLKKDLASSASALNGILESIGKSAGQAAEAVQSTVGKGADQAAEVIQSAGGAIWNTLAESTGGTLVTWRDKAGGTLAALFSGVAGWSGSLGQGIDTALTYHTGEMTYGGSFQCKNCGTVMNLKKPGHLPPCPKCHKTDFQRA